MDGQNGGEQVDLAGAFELAQADSDDSGNQGAAHHGHDDQQNPPIEGEELDLGGDELDDDGQGDADDPVFEIPVGGGKTIQKTQSELIAEASKYHGAEKKFEEAAAIRKDAEAKIAQIPERERQLGQVLEYYIHQSQAIMAAQQPNWDALMTQGPEVYLRARHAWEQHEAELRQAMNAKAMLDDRNSQEQTAIRQERLKQAVKEMREAIPEWQDPAKAKAGADAIGEYLTKCGIPEEMQKSIDSSAVLMIARKAMLYDQAIARQNAARNGPKVPPRVARPGGADVTPRGQVARANANKAHKSNPTTDTLAAFFE
ncbi:MULTISPECIES: response regulator receiver protein [Pandoraea]|uniref:response regulator receiver protein n=1 Tax=Pandoraea TaxID=93217 RepID=UPI001F5CC3CA|nr:MULTISPECIES: response regulator receiver protein [Pandoraea]MCI3206553.1 response regulator receiver protein [Pandoraea sp. LA3]MDN4584581.1 response regulator receiver protein [Pandoraea capi]